jgi:hypothetical protein
MEPEIPVRVADMRTTSRDFQRDFARMKARARAGEVISIVSGTEEFVFQAVKPRPWQGALRGKGQVKGDLFSTGVEWEASR